MMSQDGIKEQITNILTGSSLSVGSVITQDIAQCKLNGKAYAVYSPINFQVTDALGNSLGIAEDGSTGGGREKDVIELAKAAAKMKNLRVTGIMVMPPLFENPEEARPYFHKARELAGSFGFQELSMGTSHDFEVAIEEGATWVRVGTEIFGPRGETE
jgi:uncharacterized pyridoxal phosphate-containing UPF0001 family protein